MHVSGWLLILALLVLGGILSTLGDRLGSKVGKARLSLFNLRPRKTAVVITALTGSLISAISLGLMLLVSERLRVGLFELDQLQDRLREGRQALSTSQADLQQSRSDLDRNQKELQSNQRELQRSRSERNRALQGRQAAIRSERKVTEALTLAESRVGNLRRALQPLQNQRRLLEAERDRLTQEVKGRDADIQRTEKELAGVRARITAGARELQELEGKVIALRRGDVLIASGQPLAMARVRLGRQDDRRASIDALLQEANAAASACCWQERRQIVRSCWCPAVTSSGWIRPSANPASGWSRSALRPTSCGGSSGCWRFRICGPTGAWCAAER